MPLRRRIFAHFLFLLMLTTNLSVTFATHYCGGKAVKSSLSLGYDKLSCGMSEKEEVGCNNEDIGLQISRKSCCENKYSTLSVEDDFTISGVFSTNYDFKICAVFVVDCVNNFIFEDSDFDSFIAYSPPLIEQNKSVLFQVFRI